MPARPNILFLHSDEHSFRFLSARAKACGGEPCRTPTLDGLIAQGVHFDAAYCQMPCVHPSDHQPNTHTGFWRLPEINVAQMGVYRIL